MRLLEWLLIISLPGVFAQRPLLSLDNTVTTSANSISYAIPKVDDSPLSLSFALCSTTDNPPTIFVSTTGNDDSVPDKDASSRPVSFDNGLATFTSHFTLGGVLDIVNPSALTLEIGLSSSAPIHRANPSLPVLGDTTSSQAILFSYIVSQLEPIPAASFPNFTFPVANMSQPPIPQGNNNNISLVILPTPSQSTIPRTACSLSSQSSAGTIVSTTLWARDPSGFRFQYLVSNLSPQTNYTAYLVDMSSSSRSISGPIYFTTKSPLFRCTLAHSLSFCPSVAYSIPLEPPPTPPSSSNFSSYTSENLPSPITSPILSYLANFTTVLSSFPCGRDVYSPIVTCTDCEREYRKWLCSISFPRCGEPPPSLAASWSPGLLDPLATGMPSGPFSQQQPLPALLPLSPSVPFRNPTFSTNFSQSSTTSYTVLPCIEQCYAVDRACPPFLQFKCPATHFNAAYSYALGYIDRIEPDGSHRGTQSMGKGWTGEAQDRWGNVWCLMT